MSVVSNFLGSGLKQFISSLFKGAIKDGLDIYINTEFGRYILTISAVEEREDKGKGIYFYISTEWGIIKFDLYPNN